MPRRILINTMHGGFSLSAEAKALYRELTKNVERPPRWYMDGDVARDDPILLHVIDSLGIDVCSGRHTKLGIVELPDEIPADGWIIQEYDGMEWVAQKHRTWYAGC